MFKWVTRLIGTLELHLTRFFPSLIPFELREENWEIKEVELPFYRKKGMVIGYVFAPKCFSIGSIQDNFRLVSRDLRISVYVPAKQDKAFLGLRIAMESFSNDKALKETQKLVYTFCDELIKLRFFRTK